MEETRPNTASPVARLSRETLEKLKFPRKFEIFVEEFDEEGGPHGQPRWKPVKVDPALGGNGSNPVITVSSGREMQERMQMYKQLGQRFRVLREIDPPSDEELRKAAAEQGLIDESNGPGAVVSGQDSSESGNDNVMDKNAPERFCQRTDELVPKQAQQKPKVITIGDTQIKYDGEKVYQKQWVRLTSQEAMNFRVVNDSSNKLVALAGKHIEARRWVLVENAAYDEDQTEDIINA